MEGLDFDGMDMNLEGFGDVLGNILGDGGDQEAADDIPSDLPEDYQEPQGYSDLPEDYQQPQGYSDLPEDYQEHQGYSDLPEDYQEPQGYSDLSEDYQQPAGQSQEPEDQPPAPPTNQGNPRSAPVNKRRPAPVNQPNPRRPAPMNQPNPRRPAPPMNQPNPQRQPPMNQPNPRRPAPMNQPNPRRPAPPMQAAPQYPPRMNQPNPQRQYPEPGTGAWSTDLFNCFDDIPLCCLTCWCPCIVFGRIAEIVDKGATLFSTSATIYAVMLGLSGFQFIYSCSYRNKIRLQYGIVGDDFGDYCTHLWCECCALNQEYKELTNRGYDLPLGWHVNMARQKQAQGIRMAPVAPPAMTR